MPPGFVRGLLIIQARDVSSAFFQAISKRRTGRYLIAGGVTDYDTFASIAAELRPDLEAAGVVPQHLKEDRPVSKGCYQIDTTKARQELGITCELKDGG